MNMDIYDTIRFYKPKLLLFCTKGIELKPTENKYLFRVNCYMELEEFDLALSDFNSSIEKTLTIN